MQGNNQPPRTYARLIHCAQAPKRCWKPGKKSRLTLRRINSTGQVRTWSSSSSRIRLCGSCEFEQGFFYVQDPSTLLAVTELAPVAGESVLDLCAAPGGKTTFIAQRMGNQGRVIAQDHNSQRLRLLEENCTPSWHHLRWYWIRPGVEPATMTGAVYDRVLVDAPCSNTGVLRRRVDLRWRIRVEEIDRLQSGQSALLADAARQVGPGGTLVYSTCSLEPEENQRVVERFLAERPEFKRESERELLPFKDGVDGAYVARLVRAPGDPPMP